MLSKCQEDKLNLYFKWMFILLFIFGITLFYKQLGNFISNINIQNIINLFSLVKNNLDVFLVVIVTLTIITLVLYHNNTTYNHCNESFINGISKDKILCSLQTFQINLKDVKKLKEKYPSRVNKKKVDSLIHITDNIIEILRTTNIKEFGPMAIYEMIHPLLEIYYEEDKGAKELSIDLGIPIIVPNRKLEDEYRSRFSKVHSVKDREVYPQMNFSNIYHHSHF